jgi:multidrug transporter EmrE-like cation transporter
LKNYLLILPVAFLVAYSQVIVKWRTLQLPNSSSGIFDFLLRLLSDPVIFSAYIAALLASFAWLFVVTKLPLSIAFPIYIGITFAIVIFGGWFFLNEEMNAIKITAIILIFSGIVLGVKS